MKSRIEIRTGILYMALAISALLNCVLIPYVHEAIFEGIFSGNHLTESIFTLLIFLAICAALRWVQGECRIAVLKKNTAAKQKQLLYAFMREKGMMSKDVVGMICKTSEEYHNLKLQFQIGAITIALSFVFLSLYISVTSPALFLFILLITAVLLLLVMLKNKSLQKQAQIVAENENHIVTIQWEHINNQEISKFLDYDKVFSQYLEKMEDVKKASIQMMRMVYIPSVFKMLGGAFLTIFIAFFGGLLCSRNYLEMPQLFGVLSAIPALTSSLLLVPSTVGDYYKLKGLRKSMPDDMAEPGDAMNAQEHETALTASQIVCEGVCYQGILQNLSFTVQSGSLQIISGESGCGKTTLIKLLIGLRHPDNGTIYYDGRILSDMRFEIMRKSVFYFSSTPYIPNGIRLRAYAACSSYKEQPVYTYEKIIEALNLETLDKRDHLDIRSISEGEKQKIMFAKMFLSPKTIWICDEPTNKLDEDCEKDILMMAKTIIQIRQIIAVFVTHRTNTKKLADQVWVLANGGIQNEGIK